MSPDLGQTIKEHVKRMLYFTFLSVIIHLALRSGIFTLAHYVEFKKPNPVTEIFLVEKETKKEKEKFDKPIIKQLDSTEIINDKSLARFDSEKTQRVKQETTVRNLGLTKNPVFKSTPHVKAPPTPPSQDDELPEFARASAYHPQPQQQSQEAAVSMTLPGDIKFSSATNLNTDSNIYYTFYSRVEELFYVRWSERLNYYWDRVDYNFKKNQLSGRTWTTDLEVWLTATGEFHSAHIFRASGYKPFDEAAVFAFKDARFFPNPPRAKVEPDGFIRLKYRLAVRVGPFQ